MEEIGSDVEAHQVDYDSDTPSDKVHHGEFDVDPQGELDYDEFAGSTDGEPEIPVVQVRDYGYHMDVWMSCGRYDLIT